MNRLIRSSVVVLALALAACTPKPESLVPQIQRESQVFLNAISSGNVEETKKLLLGSVCDEVTAAAKLMVKDANSGIREIPTAAEIVEAMLEDRNTPFRQNGFSICSATVGVPGTPQFVNGVFVSFVPARTIARYDDGGNAMKMRLFGPKSVTLDSHIVAVSKNKGKTWKFFEASQNPALIDKFIPETASKLVVPARLIEVTSQ